VPDIAHRAADDDPFGQIAQRAGGTGAQVFRNTLPRSSNRRRFSKIVACSNRALAATDLNDWMKRLPSGMSRNSAMAHGPASCASPPRMALSSQKHRAERKTALVPSGASKRTSPASPAPAVVAMTEFVVPKSMPTARAVGVPVAMEDSFATGSGSGRRLWQRLPLLATFRSPANGNARTANKGGRVD
jgi:hypothetical protein